MTWEYSNLLKKLFKNAFYNRENSHIGVIKNPDGVGNYGSIQCGDAITLYFKVKKHKTDPLQDVIVDAKYETFGCTSAIASSEALCYLVISEKMTPVQALEITNDRIVEFLEGMPDQKIHCSVMGSEVLKVAIADWASKRGVDISPYLGEDDMLDHEKDGRVVCDCFELTEPYLRRKISELNLKTPEEVTNALKAGGACGLCIDRPGGINEILQDVWGGTKKTTTQEEESTINLKDIQGKVEKTFEKEITPKIEEAGGKVEFIGVRGNKVYCNFQYGSERSEMLRKIFREVVLTVLKEKINTSVKLVDV